MGWVEREMALADFGDQRLNNRSRILLERLSDKPNVSIPAACKGWGETMAAYRFFDNAKVKMPTVLQPHFDATIERMRQHPVVLCIQDTTDLNFTGKSETEGLGPLTYSAERGLFLHPTLAVTPDRLALGTIDTWLFVRDSNTHGKKPKDRPIEEKESIRWLEGYYRVSELQAQVPGTQLVYVADRESDIYELFSEGQRIDIPPADWLIRAAQDRNLAEEEKKLWDVAESAPVLGEIEFDKPRTNDQATRRVVQTLRAVRVTLKPPYRKGNKLPEVEVTVILAREENPPKGTEAVEWLLLTNLTVGNLKQAVEKLKWYLCRWQIEIFFRILKSGCKVEDLQLKSEKRIEPALALYMIIAWRILFLTMMGRECPNLPSDVVFDEQEWKTAYLISKRESPPDVPPPLQEIIVIIAGFGGFLGRKGDGFPGPQTIWLGIQRLRDFMIALDAQASLTKNNCV